MDELGNEHRRFRCTLVWGAYLTIPWTHSGGILWLIHL